MRVAALILLVAALALAAVGCARVSAPYVGTMTRVDQNIEEGNRGYLAGTPPAPGERKLTRQLITVDVDVPDRVSDNSVDTFAGKRGVTKTAEPGDVVHEGQAPGYKSQTTYAEPKVIEIDRQVTVTREETPTYVKQTTVVKEEEIK
jgi:hypothetical protein